MATLKGFPFHWQIGEDQVLLVSIGTGVWQRHEAIEVVTDSRLWDWASGVPSMLMEDTSWQNQVLLQYLSRTKAPWMIDREVGDLSADLLTPEPTLSYLRYNVWLDENRLNGLGLPSFVPKLGSLREMSAGENRNDLASLGRERPKGRYGTTTFRLSLTCPRC